MNFDSRISLHLFPLSESLFLRSLLNFRRVSNVANFSFTNIFPKNNIEFNFTKIIPQNVIDFNLRKVFRKMLSNIIFTRFLP